MEVTSVLHLDFLKHLQFLSNETSEEEVNHSQNLIMGRRLGFTKREADTRKVVSV
jgi:hypothetical protein